MNVRYERMQGISRRGFVKGVAGVVVSAAGVLALAGCSEASKQDGAGSKGKPEAEASFEVVSFGSYVQASGDDAAAEPLEWYVLEKRADGSKLLLSRKCLCRLPFNETWEKVAWEDSSLRAWMCGEFLETAFTEEERGRLVEGEAGDLVFALSVEEAERFQGDAVDGLGYPNLIGKPTARVAVEAGRDEADADGIFWWLRSSGNDALHAARVTADGKVSATGARVDDAGVAVRPAIVLGA